MEQEVIEKPKEKLFIKYFVNSFGTLAIGVVIYVSGSVAYSLSSNGLIYPDEYIKLNNKKTELSKKIDEWERFIPIMKEPFASQYKDSLESAVRENNEISPKIAKIKEELDEEFKKSSYSWLAFFMKDN